MSDEVKRAELPAGWAWARVDEVALVRLGRQRSPEHATGTCMRRYLRAANVTWRGFDLSDVKEMNFSPAEQLVYRLDPGDILLSEASGSLSEVGKPAIWNDEIAECYFQNTLVRVRPEGGVLPRFLHLRFLSAALRGEFMRGEGRAKGSGINHIGSANVERFLMAIAPAREQQRIVEELDLQLSRVAQTETALRRVGKSIERAREAVLQAACEGRLVPTEAELAEAEGRAFEDGAALLTRVLDERRRRWEVREFARLIAAGKVPKDEKWRERYADAREPAEALGGLPASWAQTSLDALTEIQGGITKGQTHGPKVGLRAIPYLRVANVQRGRLDLNEIKTIESTEHEIEALRLLAGDILLNEGGDRDKLGRGWVWRGEIAECIHQNHVFRSRPVMPELRSELLSWWGNTFGARFFERTGKQTTNLASINRSTLASLPVPLPPLAEQQRIVTAVEERFAAFDVLARAIEHNLARCERLRQSLLKSAFEGCLVPQDPSDEPASELLVRICAVREAREAERLRQRALTRAAKEATAAVRTLPGVVDATRAVKRGRPRKAP